MESVKREEKLADFLFEIGTLRKTARAHRQVLFSDDLSDNIASHSFRVAVIGWVLAKMEKADENKVLKMCLLHDTGETRSNDHNWIHKKYTKVFDKEIIEDQLSGLPYKDFLSAAQEYEERKTKESIIAKDADILDQILLLREYEWGGNKEASLWLYGNGKKGKSQLKKLKLKSSIRLGEAIYNQNPSDWWDNIWTPKNR